MDIWEPRTEYERKHLEKIFALVEGLPRDTPLREVSKKITSEINRWKFQDGFWLTEENRRAQAVKSTSKREEDVASVFWAFLGVAVIATPIIGLILGIITAAIFDSFEFGLWLGIIGGVAGIIWFIYQTVDFKSGFSEKPSGNNAWEDSPRVRTDLTAPQLKQIESAARTYLREVGVSRFVGLAKNEEQSIASKQRKIAKLSGLFDPSLKPEKQQFGVSDEGAESLVAQWMRWLGVFDAEVTKFVGDGGIDVESSKYIAQVKNYNGLVGIAAIRELAGVAAVDGRVALFFTSGTYPKNADAWAESAGIYLFQYDAKEGKLRACNSLAREALGRGLPSFEDSVS